MMNIKDFFNNYKIMLFLILFSTVFMNGCEDKSIGLLYPNIIVHDRIWGILPGQITNVSLIGLAITILIYMILIIISNIKSIKQWFIDRPLFSQSLRISIWFNLIASWMLISKELENLGGTILFISYYIGLYGELLIVKLFKINNEEVMQYIYIYGWRIGFLLNILIFSFIFYLVLKNKNRVNRKYKV